MPGVGHHVREGPARTKASDGSALPAIVGPPVEHRPAHQRSAQLQRSAQVAGWRRLDREACRRERATVCLLEGNNGGLAVGAAPTCRPPQSSRSSALVRAAGHNHLELEQLLLHVERHFVLGNTVQVSRWRWWADIRVAAEAVGSSEVRAQAFDVEVGEDAPRRGYVEPARVGRSAREDPEGAHPPQGEQRARREGRVLRVQQYLVPHRELHIPPGGVELRLVPVLSRLQKRPHFSSHAPIRCAAALPDQLGRVLQ